MVPTITLWNGALISPRAARSHAMKNCLSIISAVSQLVDPELSTASRERMSRLQAATFRLRDLVAHDLWEEAGRKQRTTTKSVCVTSLATSVAERLADRAATAGVKLVIQCDGGAIDGDEDALREVLFNLLTNAIEATPVGGAAFLTTHEQADSDQIWMVSDTGRGIPAEQLAELGRPLCSRKPGGFGLGIAIAQATVAMHGGLLHVESSVVSGTTISIWLPQSIRKGDGPCV